MSFNSKDTSLSARRAWIEICRSARLLAPGAVALRKESVDRNWMKRWKKDLLLKVALRKESVDRNVRRDVLLIRRGVSLSARRAWIEICVSLSH